MSLLSQIFPLSWEKYSQTKSIKIFENLDYYKSFKEKCILSDIIKQMYHNLKTPKILCFIFTVIQT